MPFYNFKIMSGKFLSNTSSSINCLMRSIKSSKFFLTSIAMIFIASCSTVDEGIPQYDRNYIMNSSGFSYQCNDIAKKAYVNNLNKSPKRRDFVIAELQFQIQQNPTDIGYTSLYQAILSDCEIADNMNSSNVDTVSITASRDQFGGLFAKFDIKLTAEPGSIKLSYDSNNNLEFVSVLLKLESSSTTATNGYPLIISQIMVSDENDNKGYFSNEALSGWRLGNIPAESHGRHIYRDVAANFAENLELNFSMKKFVSDPSKIYKFSMVIYGHKLLVQLPFKP